MKEIFLDVVGHEDSYEVSNLGTVRSKTRFIQRGNHEILKQGKVLNQEHVKQDYVRVALIKDKKIKHKYVHRLVAEAFVKNKQENYLVTHIDGNRKNNAASNLKWTNHSEVNKQAKQKQQFVNQ